MKFLSIAKRRFSVHSYISQHIESEELEKILETAHVALTIANLQPIRLIVARSKQSLIKIGKVANIYGTPLAIIVYADREKAWARPLDKRQTGDIGVSIPTDHMTLQATELSLGSVWVCCFNLDILCRELEPSEHLEPANTLAIGYSDAGTAGTSRFDRQRVTLNQLVTYEK